MAKVLVTGGCGFVGRHLVERLVERGDEVRVIDVCEHPGLSPAAEYRRASILHDVNCDRHPQDGPERRAGDEMFYAACRAGGCGRLEAKLLFLGVRLGSSWAGRGLRAAGGEDRVKLRPSADDRMMQEEYTRLAQEIAAKDAADAGAGLVARKEKPSEAIAEVDAVLAANGLAS